MKIFFIIIWLFPILFMIHDFEEIILILHKAMKKFDYLLIRYESMI